LVGYACIPEPFSPRCIPVAPFFPAFLPARSPDHGTLDEILQLPHIPWPVLRSAPSPPLIPGLSYCTISGMDATVLIPIAFLVAGSIAIILTVYMYR